ncbi:magnesium-translocating P-type ATPase [Lactobacillus sp. PV037]|uniref:magnesium-translocating P-type ATPase n=1 Tax=Lactobacillus sp. PV037 TaxID=2594496 RepID=UPI00223EF58C|nr:magnesium-translocating P-type ATPase [Lactobacillus sp. PV037]QNQ84184.1 magnesium-translocating P-type ATPase [Lactobacillus sp. PV037]
MFKFNTTNKKQQANTKLVKRIAEEDKFATLQRLKTSTSGLTQRDAEIRLAQQGPNEVVTNQRNSKIQSLIKSFFTPFSVVLIILAIISFLANYFLEPVGEKDFSTSIILAIMVCIAAVVRFVQDLKTSDAVEDLMELVSVTTNVKRNRKNVELPTQDIVVGDIINLAAGDIIPADMRLLRSKDLFCSSASLNGESQPIEKIANKKPSATQINNYLEYPNILYEGTTIVSGSGMGVVFATGDNTVFGKLARTLAKTKVKQTSFDIGIRKISTLLLLMTLIIAPLVFLINGSIKGDWSNALVFAIAIAVGLTPEMLPVIISSNLVRGSLELSKHGTIVKKMNSIQNFGSADILCTDKTGTLTQDKVVLERHFNLALEEKKKVLELAYLNSYYQTGMKDLIDKAIIEAAAGEIDTNDIQYRYTKIDEIPFDFTRRRMSVVVADAENEHLLLTKGAAEEMLACSDRVEIDGKIMPLTQQWQEKIRHEIKQMNEDGFRVVLLGYKKNPAPVGEFGPEDEKELILIGFLAFLDPPKESAKEVLNNLRKDGIKVKILTGDNEAVTRAVCLQVGLNIETVYEGSDFENKSFDEMKKMVEECDIFVKVSPEIKAKIINVLKSNDHTVAYLGDGINDAAAMRVADVSVSVDDAVDVAKKTADIILLRKDLRILEKGVRIGRQVFGNSMKYIKITLSSNFGNMLSILLASLFLPFLPMLPLQIVVLDLLYGVSCLSIPFDTMNPNYLEVPRKWHVKKLPKFMLTFGPVSSLFDILTFGFLFYYLCPKLVGHSYAAASVSEKISFMAIFCTGWFVESLWTQETVISVLRDPRFPFLKQHATLPVIIATFGVAIIGTIIPFTPLAKIMNFGFVPLEYLFFVALMLILYIGLASLVKKWYMKREKYLI